MFHSKMNGSNFHIVKSNGQLEIVKLEPIARKRKPKMTSNCGVLFPAESLKQPTSSEDNRQVSPIKNVLKTYSRIRKEKAKPLPNCVTAKGVIQTMEPASVDVSAVKPLLIPSYESEEPAAIQPMKVDKLNIRKEEESTPAEGTTVDMLDSKPIPIPRTENNESSGIKAETVNVAGVKPILPLKENIETSGIRGATVDLPDDKPVSIPVNIIEENSAIPMQENEKSCSIPAAAVDASVVIKSEPELNIVDEGLQDNESIEEIVNVDDIEVKRSGSTKVDHVITASKPIEIVKKVSNPDVINSIANMNGLSAIPNLAELELKPAKCNVCGMIFPKSDNQVKTLGRHFLKHKTSVVNVKTFYTFHKKQKLSETNGQTKDPIILNNLLKKRPKPLAVVPVIGTYEIVNKKTSRPLRTEASNSLRSLTRINKKSLPYDILNRLRSSQSNRKADKSHVVIGSTLIKPIKQATTVKPVDVKSIPVSGTEFPKSKGSDDRDISDADDDVEIIEEKPVLIVIDDNDELDMPNENVPSISKNKLN